MSQRKEQKCREVEILAPAGSYECFRAAIGAGADAVYAGGPRFGARAYADNFTEEELAAAIEEAHIHGRRFYLTVNTLLKEEEICDLYDYLNPLYRRGLDAVIVQDPGVFYLIRECFPDMDLHVSTQMTITSYAGAGLLEELGASRVVPARELSLEEIRRIREETSLEIECFVHGALCYCYSGQCLMSSMIGGRSGNRGQCAQPCRLPWTAEGKKGRLLSLKDMCTLDMIPELIEAGIDSFKIEGRMKGPEYAALTTAMYRKYTDLYLDRGREHFRVDPADRERLMDLYNRGGSGEGYYRKHNGRDMLTFDRVNHAGVPAVRVVSQKGRSVRGRAVTSLHRGDVIELGSGKENYTLGSDIRKGEEISFLVPKGKTFPSHILLNRIRNESLLQEIRERWGKGADQEQAEAVFELRTDQPGILTVSSRGVSCTERSEMKAVPALSRPLEPEGVRERLGKTGNTPFVFRKIRIEMDENIFLPVQEINRMKRSALEGLRQAILNSGRRADGIKPEQTEITEFQEILEGEKTGLVVLTETREQFLAAAAGIQKKRETPSRILRICPDCGKGMSEQFFSDRGLRKICKGLREQGIEIVPVMPSIFRQETEEAYDQMAEEIKTFPLDGMMIRNYESFAFLRKHGFDKTVILDHNLYVCNRYAKKFWRELGVREYTAPAESGKDDLKKIGMRGYTLPVYGYLPVMVTAQCVRKTVSGCTGKSGLLFLRDRKGQEYPVKNHCDLCFNVIYHPVPLDLTGPEEQKWVRDLKPERVMLRFTIENAEETEGILRREGTGQGGYPGHFLKGI